MTDADIDRDNAQCAADAQAEARELRNPLRIEMERAAGRLKIKHLVDLKARGIAAPVIAHFTGQGRLGIVHAEFDHGLWVPCEDGTPLMVTPLTEDGVVVDLVVFNPREPENWALRTGTAWALGMDAFDKVEHAWDDTERHLTLHPTPLAWIKDGGNGLCVVQWNEEARRSLRKVKIIKADDQKFVQLVRLELTRPPPIPEFEVRRHAPDGEAADGNG